MPATSNTLGVLFCLWLGPESHSEKALDSLVVLSTHAHHKMLPPAGGAVFAEARIIYRGFPSSEVADFAPARSPGAALLDP